MFTERRKADRRSRERRELAMKPPVRLKPIDWLDRFKKTHGDRYDYSKANIRDSREKIQIICSQHGAFFQRLGTHASGIGCVKCR